MLENLNMEAKDWITVCAVILGPIFAVQAQKIIESIREKKSRRLSLFKKLMSTRGERLNREHVQALNMIDIEFYGRRLLGSRFQNKREKAVTNAWKNYNDNLSSKSNYESLEMWFKDGDSLFIKLLYEMSQSLGYDYDEVQLKRDCYRPEAHANVENAQLNVLEGLAKVLNQERSLPMAVTYFPGMEQPPEQDSEHNKSSQQDASEAGASA